MLGIQAEKRKLMMTAFQEKAGKRAGAGKQARLGDIERLLGGGQESAAQGSGGGIESGGLMIVVAL